MGDKTAIEWRLLDAFPDYAVSSAGDVRRATPGKSTRTGRLLKPQRDEKSGGYLQVMIRRRKVRIHQAVLRAFIGPAPIGHEGRHVNGNKLDNRLENLAWGTKKEQHADDRRNGVQRLGTAKLSIDEVKEILSQKGQASSRSIGKTFGVSHTSVLEIWKGQRWVIGQR